MSGRGDNNKQGSSGRGASNQSTQGFGQAGQEPTSGSSNKQVESRQSLKAKLKINQQIGI